MSVCVCVSVRDGYSGCCHSRHRECDGLHLFVCHSAFTSSVYFVVRQTAELAHQAQPSNTVELQTSSKLESGSGTLTVSTTGATPVPASAELDAHRERSSTTEHSPPSESAGDAVNTVTGSDTSFPDSASVDSGSGDECVSVRDEGGDAGECGRKEPSKARREKEGKYADLESAHLYSILQSVDPESAKRLHPKNRRKIVRCVIVPSFGDVLLKLNLHTR